MPTPRIYVSIALSPGARILLPSAQARHVGQVLRLTPGAPLTLFNGDGHEYPARLLETSREATRLVVESRAEQEPKPPLAIHLAIGISKGERMDFALQKAVELGVDAITPLFTERSQVKLDAERLNKRLEHWRGIIVSACEQCGRRRLPTLHRPQPLEPWLMVQTAGGLLLDPHASQALANLPPPLSEVTLLVGPEGGLSPSEHALAEHQGFRGTRLGPRILRTETAPLAAIAVIQALWGDFRHGG